MPLRMIIFMVVMPAVWTALHVYMGRRLLVDVRGGTRRWGWAAVAMLALLPIVAFVSMRLGDGAALRTVQWLGYVMMGISSVLFFGVLAADVVRRGTRLGRRIRARRSAQPDLADVSRRGFLARGANIGILAGTGSVAGVGLVQAARPPEVVEVEVPIEGLPAALDGYRIVQISDVHIGPSLRGDFLSDVVDRVNALEPDLVAVTGDLIDGYVENLAPEMESLKRLAAADGAFFVTGNHEYYWDGEAWCQHVADLGLTVLNNQHRVIERGGAKLLLAGVTDYSAGGHVAEHRSDPTLARKGAPVCDVDVLLAHQPRSVFAAADAGYDLQISGHTHGGQYFPMNVFVHLVQPYVAGLERHAEKMWIYVSRGTAYWGPPLRVGAPHEITVLRLVPA